MADLYHVTVRSSVEDIFADGLKQNAAIRARQSAADAAGEDELDPMAPTPNEEVADRNAEELIGEARREADIPADWPRHSRGVFFWPDKSRAEKVAEDTGLYGGADPIVAVDSTALPDSTTCLTGDANQLDPIFNTYWRQAAGRERVSPEDEQRMLENIIEWWETVEVYTGQSHYGYEVWCGSDVPPEAIEWIHDPANDRRLYEPPDDPEQQRFIDLF